MLAAGTRKPAVTSLLLNVSRPAVGTVVIRTARKLLGGVSSGSVKPKSAAVKV